MLRNSQDRPDSFGQANEAAFIDGSVIIGKLMDDVSKLYGKLSSLKLLTPSEFATVQNFRIAVQEFIIFQQEKEILLRDAEIERNSRKEQEVETGEAALREIFENEAEITRDVYGVMAESEVGRQEFEAVEVAEIEAGTEEERNKLEEGEVDTVRESIKEEMVEETMGETVREELEKSEIIVLEEEASEGIRKEALKDKSKKHSIETDEDNNMIIISCPAKQARNLYLFYLRLTDAIRNGEIPKNFASMDKKLIESVRACEFTLNTGKQEKGLRISVDVPDQNFNYLEHIKLFIEQTLESRAKKLAYDGWKSVLDINPFKEKNRFGINIRYFNEHASVIDKDSARVFNKFRYGCWVNVFTRSNNCRTLWLSEKAQRYIEIRLQFIPITMPIVLKSLFAAMMKPSNQKLQETIDKDLLKLINDIMRDFNDRKRKRKDVSDDVSNNVGDECELSLSPVRHEVTSPRQTPIPMTPMMYNGQPMSPLPIISSPIDVPRTPGSPWSPFTQLSQFRYSPSSQIPMSSSSMDRERPKVLPPIQINKSQTERLPSINTVIGSGFSLFSSGLTMPQKESSSLRPEKRAKISEEVEDSTNAVITSSGISFTGNPK